MSIPVLTVGTTSFDLMLPDGEIRVAVGSDAVSVLGQAAVPLLGPELLTQQVTGRSEEQV